MITSSETEDKCCTGEPVQSRIWLQVDGQDLLHTDWDILQEGRCLNDRHINYAQKLLKLQFQCLEGINLTLFQSKVQKSKIKEGLQEIHCKKRDHWVVASNLACETNEAMVFDLSFDSVGDETESVIKKIMGKLKYPCRKCKSKADQTTVVFSL